jgi:hypothetical protein
MEQPCLQETLLGGVASHVEDRSAQHIVRHDACEKRLDSPGADAVRRDLLDKPKARNSDLYVASCW